MRSHTENWGLVLHSRYNEEAAELDGLPFEFR